MTSSSTFRSQKIAAISSDLLLISVQLDAGYTNLLNSILLFQISRLRFALTSFGTGTPHKRYDKTEIGINSGFKHSTLCYKIKKEGDNRC